MQTSGVDPASDLGKSIVRNAVVDLLATRARAGTHGPFAADRLFRETCDKLVERGVLPSRLDRSPFLGLAPDDARHQPDFGAPAHVACLIREVLWDLYVQGILAPAPVRQRPEREPHSRTVPHRPPFPFLYLDYGVLTQYGAQILSDATDRIRVHDPDGYLTNFRSADPPADQEMMRYVKECVSVFRGGHFLATIVLLGVASERLVEVLAESLHDALGDPAGAEWFNSKYSNKRDISARFKALSGRLMAEYGEELSSEKLKGPFNGVVTLTFEQLRLARNDIAHPQGREFTWNETSGFLHNFVQYFIYANRIIAFLESKHEAE
jgi:hypothetical protein